MRAWPTETIFNSIEYQIECEIDYKIDCQIDYEIDCKTE